MKAELKRTDVGEYLKLVPYSELRGRIEAALAQVRPSVEKVPVDEALGRVSAEEARSPCDIPESPSSMMDGYAVRSSELVGADPSHPVTFRVIGSLSPASKPAPPLSGLDSYYVATGAPVPRGADAVVKVEETRLSGERILVSLTLPKGKNVAPRGDDVKEGSPVVKLGQIVNAPGIALLVASRRTDLAVFCRPRVGILSTGDELTGLRSGETAKKVNNYANLVAAYLTEAGAVPVQLGIAGDDEEQIAQLVRKGTRELDAVVTIGGSSIGRRDFTANAMRSIDGCEELFHGVRLVPARPTGMFMLDGKPVVLLPGHSVAASLAFFLVVRPVVNILSGLKFDSRSSAIKVRLTQEVSNPRPVGALFLVSLESADGAFSATPVRWGSNLISSLACANAFLQVQPRSSFLKGEAVTVTLLGTGEMLRIPESGAS